MDAVYNFGEILLFIKISQFEDEALKIIRGRTKTRGRGCYLGKPNVIADKIKEIVYVVGVSKIQFPCLIKRIK